jgi:hypothetical protein
MHFCQVPIIDLTICYQKKINVCLYIVEMTPLTVLSMSHQGKEEKEGRTEGNGEKS